MSASAVQVTRGEAPITITMPEATARRLTALLSIVQDIYLQPLIDGLESALPEAGHGVAFDAYYRALDDASEELTYPEIEAR